ncbi:MAG TPA: hypothetical protein QGF58_12480 [Myxococcota bacterium]|nr:hypothetical protein [Myxococcota bacterium]
MCALLLGFALTSPVGGQEPPEEAPEALVEDSADSGDSGTEEEVVEPTAGRKDRRRASRNRGDVDGRDYTPYYIAVAALLGLWLVSRMQPQRQETTRRPLRHDPVSDDELGRFVFHAVLTADLDEYRELFLTGGEAHKVLHGGAQNYMEQRSEKALEDTLVELSVHVPEGAMFSGTTRVGDVLHLEVRNDRDASRSVPVGTTARVGAVLRLMTPAAQLLDRGAGSA